MNEGVKILLARMETNPEEFIAPPNTGASKWGYLIESYRDSLDVEDQQAIKEGYKKIHQQRFTELVMKELLAPEEDDSLGKPWYSNTASVIRSLSVPPTIPSITLNSGAVTGTIGVGGTWGTSPYTTKEALDAQKYQTEQMRAHLDAQKQKPHKTLFGKLFNYS
jgi:hypothetical protein